MASYLYDDRKESAWPPLCDCDCDCEPGNNYISIYFPGDVLLFRKVHNVCLLFWVGHFFFFL